MRPDVSQIHPLKRATLIVLRYMFGTSTALAIFLQFFWVIGHLIIPGSKFVMEGQRNSLTLTVTSDNLPRWSYDYHWIHHPESAYGWSWTVPVAREHRLLPGFYYTFGNWTRINIHHFWFIGITAALYLFTRWRIRRTARLQSQPS